MRGFIAWCKCFSSLQCNHINTGHPRQKTYKSKTVYFVSKLWDYSPEINQENSDSKIS